MHHRGDDDHREQHEPEREPDDRHDVGPEVADRRVDRGAEQERRQEDQEHELRLEVDLGQPGHEREREPTEQEQARVGHAAAAARPRTGSRSRRGSPGPRSAHPRAHDTIPGRWRRAGVEGRCPTYGTLCSMRKTSVYLTDDEAEGLRQLAVREGRPQAELIREGVRQRDRSSQASDREPFGAWPSGAVAADRVDGPPRSSTPR